MTAGAGPGTEGDAAAGRMRALLVPVYGSNPYSRLLASALREAGVEVATAGVSGWLPLFRAVRAEGRPDVVHLQWQHRFFLREEDGVAAAAARTALFFLQWMVLRLAGVRFVWTVHNLVNHERHLEGLERAACRLLARAVEGIVVHCEEVVETVARAYGVPRDRVDVIPHGHYIGAYPDSLPRGEARSAIGLPDDATVFLHFGQIRPYKGVRELMRTVSAMESDGLCLVILGEPRYEELGDELRKLASRDSRIRLELRYAREEELMRHLAAADAVVLPYVDILTSGSAILAASCARPIVAPDVGCLREFPEDAIIRYEPEGPRGLESALRVAGGSALDRMGRSARSFVENFPWGRVGAKTAAFYERVLTVGRDTRVESAAEER